MGIKHSTRKLNVSKSRVHYKRKGVGRPSHSFCACVSRNRPQTDSPLQDAKSSKSHVYGSNGSFPSWENITLAPQLSKDRKWHVQFICSVSDLHVVEYATKYLSHSGYSCVELDSYALAGKTEPELIDEFTSKSLWNIVIASRSMIEDKLGFQIGLAVDLARHLGRRNVIVIHTEDNMDDAIPALLLPFKKVKRHKRDWLAHLASILRNPPEAFLQAEESLGGENHFDVEHDRKRILRTEDNRSYSDDHLRAKRLQLLQKTPFNGDRAGAQLQSEMRKRIKYPMKKKITMAAGGLTPSHI